MTVQFQRFLSSFALIAGLLLAVYSATHPLASYVDYSCPLNPGIKVGSGFSYYYQKFTSVKEELPYIDVFSINSGCSFPIDSIMPLDFIVLGVLLSSVGSAGFFYHRRQQVEKQELEKPKDV